MAIPEPALPAWYLEDKGALNLAQDRSRGRGKKRQRRQNRRHQRQRREQHTQNSEETEATDTAKQTKPRALSLRLTRAMRHMAYAALCELAGEGTALPSSFNNRPMTIQCSDMAFFNEYCKAPSARVDSDQEATKTSS